MRFFLALVLALMPASWAWQQDSGVVTLPAPADPTLAEIDGIFQDLARITGLKPLRKVEYTRIDKDKVKAFLTERIKEVVKPEEIREEETALKKFGFVPKDFNLEKTTIDLMSEQAAAFYDYRKQKLFLINAGPEMMQHSVLVHELAHALADQHFGLEKYMEEAKKNDDASLARLAVLEGQATWLMSEYLTRKTGQSLKDSPVLVKMMSTTASMDDDRYPIFAGAPLYLRETLMFPYTKGMLFQHRLFEKLDQGAFAQAFRKPPVSTQQILHPEKYLEFVRPAQPQIPDIPGAGDYRTFTEGEIGELDHWILLRQYAGDESAKALAEEWRGGLYRIHERKRDGKMVLAYASEWATPDAARKFFAAYRKVLRGKWSRFEATSESAGALAGRGDDGAFRLRVEGTRVTSVEGLP